MSFVSPSSFVDHLACDTLQLFTLLPGCASTFWLCSVFHVCPASRLLALHLYRTDRGGVRCTSTVMLGDHKCCRFFFVLLRSPPLQPRGCPSRLLLARSSDRHRAGSRAHRALVLIVRCCCVFYSPLKCLFPR